MRLELVPGRYRRRYKRFFADVELSDGRSVVAHLPNTGSMKTLDHPGCEAWLVHRPAPHRRLEWTLTLLGVPGGKALVDTALPNRIVEAGIIAGKVPELSGYERVQREVRVGERSRIDLRLEGPIPCYVEIKNVTMASSGSEDRADFPDARTDRGRKHLDELTTLAQQGYRVVMFFLLGRSDRRRVGLAESIDPEYARAARQARGAGVEFLSYGARIRTNGVSLGSRVPVDF